MKTKTQMHFNRPGIKLEQKTSFPDRAGVTPCLAVSVPELNLDNILNIQWCNL